MSISNIQTQLKQGVIAHSYNDCMFQTSGKWQASLSKCDKTIVVDCHEKDNKPGFRESNRYQWRFPAVDYPKARNMLMKAKRNKSLDILTMLVIMFCTGQNEKSRLKNEPAF